MTKIILGVFIGIVSWGCLLSVGDYLWIKVSPDWYGQHQSELQTAISQNKSFITQTSILIIVVIRSIVYSVISGFITAIISYENHFSTIILGFLLSICCFLIHLTFWDFVPYWFHLLVLFQFIPFNMLGGSLIKFVPKYPKPVF